MALDDDIQISRTERVAGLLYEHSRTTFQNYENLELIKLFRFWFSRCQTQAKPSPEAILIQARSQQDCAQSTQVQQDHTICFCGQGQETW